MTGEAPEVIDIQPQQLAAVGNIASGASNGITFVIDSLFVFRDDRRTVHDLIVGSKVIQL